MDLLTSIHLKINTGFNSETEPVYGSQLLQRDETAQSFPVVNFVVTHATYKFVTKSPQFKVYWQ